MEEGCRIDYSPSSIQSLRQIKKYLADWSEVAPLTVTSMIKERIDGLKRFPRMGKVVEKRPRFRCLVAGEYLVYYEIKEEKKLVRIADIIHSKRQQEIDRLIVG